MKCLLFLLLTVLSSASLSAQALTAQKEKEKELERLRLRAVSMIEQTAAETLLWDDRKAAAGVLVDAAELRLDLVMGFLSIGAGVIAARTMDFLVRPQIVGLCPAEARGRPIKH